MDLGLEIEKTNVGIRIIILKIPYVPIFRNNFDFFVQICPKMPRNSENQCPNKNRHPRDTICTNFQAKKTTLTFSAQNLLKKESWGRNFKNLSLDSESALPIYHVCQFSVKMNNFRFFGLNLGKLSSCVRYFGSNNVVGVAESWMEVDAAGWSLE